MKKICCVKCRKCKIFKNPEISYLFYKTLVVSIICGKCGSKRKRIFKEEESTEILKTLGLIEYIIIKIYWIKYIINLKIWRKKTKPWLKI